MRQQTRHKWMVVNLSAILMAKKMFLMRAFYCVQTNPLCKWYIEPYGKNYQADTDALNENVVQYRGECERNVSQISTGTNVVSTKWYHFGINAIFLQQKPEFI